MNNKKMSSKYEVQKYYRVQKER